MIAIPNTMATAPLPTAWLVVLIKLVPAVGRKGPREPSAKSRSRSLFELTIFLRKITSNAPAIRRNKPTQRGISLFQFQFQANTTVASQPASGSGVFNPSPAEIFVPIKLMLA
jgi:hypothetical protein